MTEDYQVVRCLHSGSKLTNAGWVKSTMLRLAFGLLVVLFAATALIAGTTSASSATSTNHYDVTADFAQGRTAERVASGASIGHLEVADIPSEQLTGCRYDQPPDLVAPRVGSGSGPWVDDVLTTPICGFSTVQSLPGSCVSACGDVLMAGARTEAQLLEALGEWSNPHALASELGGPWVGTGFGSGADALAAARRGPMGAHLVAPGFSHMVVTAPMDNGLFRVLDPWDGTGFVADSAWIERWVAGGVFQ